MPCWRRFMAIEIKDYYFILGISKSAGDEEIRRAFRKLARLYHPDIAGNDRAAEDKFKEINEAYEVLSDPEKRKRYDDFSTRWKSPGGGGQMPPGWESFSKPGGPSAGKADHFTFTGTGFSEFFDQLFSSTTRNRTGPQSTHRARPQPAPDSEEEIDGQGGDDLEADIWVTLEEVAHGAVRPITMRRSVNCPSCFGVGQYNGHRCEKCQGTGHTERTDRYKVKIPQGIPEGTCLRIPGQGEEGIAGAPPGDLYLKVQYASHPDFRIEDNQLCYELLLAPWEAVLGINLTVPTLKAGVQIKIPPGTQAGQKIRVKEKGLPARDGSPGDLIIVPKIQVPRESSEREQMLWRELASSSVFYPREH